MIEGGIITVPANNIVRTTSNDVILMVLTGQQTRESVFELTNNLALTIQQIKKQQKPVLVICDIDHLVTTPEPAGYEAREEALNMLVLPFDAMAICYGGPETVKLAQELVRRAASQETVRTFANTREAAAWLASFSPGHKQLP
jgi:hypothetical protein